MLKLCFAACWVLGVLCYSSDARAQEGELRGVVLDKATRQPLVGAQITIAALPHVVTSDSSGAFTFFGLAPGTHALRVAHALFTQAAQFETMIHARLTTEVEILLDEAAPQLVPRFAMPQFNYAGTLHLLSREQILQHSTRGMDNLLRFQAGVVAQDDALHVRGGRSGELAYAIEGMNVTSPLSRAQLFEAIPEAIAEVQLHSGVYGADMSGGNSGVVQTILQTGGATPRFTLDYRTDDFAKPGEQFLQTTAFGLRNAVATLSGPLGGLRYFIAGEHSYVRDRALSFVAPFRYEQLTGDGILDPGRQPLPDAVAFERNYLPFNWLQRNKVMGNLTYALGRMNVRLSGGYQKHEQPHGSASFAWSLTNYFNRENGLRDLSTTAFGQLHASYAFSAKTFLVLDANHSIQNASLQDPNLGEDWMKYYDRNYSDYPEAWRSRFGEPLPHSIINAFRMARLGSPNGIFSKSRESHLGLAGHLTSQIHRDWQIKLGAQLEQWRLRQYRVGGLNNLMPFLYGFDGTFERTFESEYVRKTQVSRAGKIDNYGYNIDGEEIDNGVEGPRTPRLFALYAQTQYHAQKLHMQVGLRYERIAFDALVVQNLENPQYDAQYAYISESGLRATEAKHYLLPRFAATFQLRPRTGLYTTLGQFVQAPALAPVYQSLRQLSVNTIPFSRSPYGYFGQYVGFTAAPEKLLQFEMGVRHMFTPAANMSLNYYYKTSKNLLHYDFIQATSNQTVPAGTPYLTGLLNGDRSKAQGVEMTIELRLFKRLTLAGAYIIAEVRGTGSEAASSLVYTSDAVYPLSLIKNPQMSYALDYNQGHRGALNLDYRFRPEESTKLLRGFGFTMNLNFNSGHSYTLYEMPAALGAGSVWTLGIRPLNDLRLAVSDEAPNSHATPYVYEIDLGLDKAFRLAGVSCTFYAHVLNVLNRKNVINVFPTTGQPDDDGWLQSRLASLFTSTPGYADFYQAINLQNGWEYSLITGNDMYGTPRQIRLGLRVEFF